MPKEILVALCLVLVIEGLFLFAFPRAWQRMAADLARMEPHKLRAGGGFAIILGLIFLHVVR
jgi:hypothetical protein